MAQCGSFLRNVSVIKNECENSGSGAEPLGAGLLLSVCHCVRVVVVMAWSVLVDIKQERSSYC